MSDYEQRAKPVVTRSSAVAIGTTISGTALAPRPADAAAMPPKTKAHASGRLSLLVISSDKAFCETLTNRTATSTTEKLEVEGVAGLREAIRHLSSPYYDAVILDLAADGCDSNSALQQIVGACLEIPIIAVGDRDDEDAALDALQLGAQEYLVKGTSTGQILMKSVRYAINRKQWEQRLVELAQHDHLTGLPNRMLFQDRLDQALREANRSGILLGIMFLDLDRFKDINDTLGHAVGDKLLQSVAGRLRACIRDSDTVARLGGDEFAIITRNLQSIAEIGYLARRIIEALAKPHQLDGHEIHCTASIGVTVHPINEGGTEQLLKNADLALYRAKETGRDGFQFYDTEMNKSVQTRKILERQIRRALEKQEFILHYQPNVDARTGKVVGSEALVRWQSPSRGLVPPNDFIPLAEETGLIVPMGAWVLREACRQAKEWQDSGNMPGRVAVNLSPVQFRRRDFAETVMEILDETKLDPNNLELEITENVVMGDFNATAHTLETLYNNGIRLVIDDFGTGYSSLTYLKRFPVYKLKIDRSFVRDITTNPEDAAIATAIIGMAHNLKLQVIGEGVETLEQKAYLENCQCDEFQGFYFTKPLSPLQFADWVRTRV